jgi:hypothetical protein
MSHIYFSSLGGEVAQWLAHKPVELGVAGSSPVFLATLKQKTAARCVKQLFFYWLKFYLYQSGLLIDMFGS